jgi:uncharacterized protein YjiS (DUF1127 family)
MATRAAGCLYEAGLALTTFGIGPKDQGEKTMEMHSQRSLYEIHGISAPPRRRSRRSWILRRALARLLAALKAMKAAIIAELAARHAIAELASMNDHMLRDLGITRGEIESTVRRSRASIGMDYGPLVSNGTGQGDPALPTVSSPDLTSEGRPEQQLQRLRSW